MANQITEKLVHCVSYVLSILQFPNFPIDKKYSKCRIHLTQPDSLLQVLSAHSRC
jgi:hypothetical protein